MGVIEAVDVTKSFRVGGTERTVLEHVSFDVAEGRFVSVMGPSGSGKSTLLHILGGLDRAHAGSVSVDGVVLGDCDDDALAAVRRRSVGFVFQAFNLVPVLSAVENVMLAGIIDGRATGACRRRALELLDLLGLADRSEQRPAELSGGEQQRVAIARALFLEPAVVLADEPTGNLDSAGGGEVIDVLAAANRDLGKTIVMVTHDPNIAIAADEVVAMSDGGLCEPMCFAASEAVPDRRRRLGRWLQAGPSPTSSRPEVVVAP